MQNAECEMQNDEMRGKLAELICQAHNLAADAGAFEDATYAEQIAAEADFLIGNGVTIPVRCWECALEGTADCPTVHRDRVMGNLWTDMSANGYCSRGRRKDETDQH